MLEWSVQRCCVCSMSFEAFRTCLDQALLTWSNLITDRAFEQELGLLLSYLLVIFPDVIYIDLTVWKHFSEKGNWTAAGKLSRFYKATNSGYSQCQTLQSFSFMLSFYLHQCVLSEWKQLFQDKVSYRTLWPKFKAMEF